jgi:hypothetical protein
MKTLKPSSFGDRGLIGEKVVAKEANRVSGECAITNLEAGERDNKSKSQGGHCTGRPWY